MDPDLWPDNLRLPDLEERFVCTVCGHRGADVRPLFEPARMGTEALRSLEPFGGPQDVWLRSPQHKPIDQKTPAPRRGFRWSRSQNATWVSAGTRRQDDDPIVSQRG
jgi:hypothetical protein